MSELNAKAIREGNRLALTRALTAVENDEPSGQALLTALYPYTGQAHLIGVTGAPGTGKSTLVNQLAKAFRTGCKTTPVPKVAIIAVDPTSPFTGGALLGDRIRMRDLSGDKGIFIRSMASRGALGGLAHHTTALTTILDGAGYEIIIIETVGAGQAEVEIAQLAHTVIVVEAPGLGDDIQAIKAGILEIADILVVNKADRPGAENTARALKAMLEMAKGGVSLPPAGKHLRQSPSPSATATAAPQETHRWQPPVKLVTATLGEGIDELTHTIQEHRQYLLDTDRWHLKESYRIKKDLDSLIQEKLMRDWRSGLDQETYKTIFKQIIRREISPYQALDFLISAQNNRSNRRSK
jgi:LAO/AO transport system kinase